MSFDGMFSSNVGATSAVSATITIAASDSPKKQGADYICTGSGDQTVINAALAALPAGGGVIKLLRGNYSISAPIIIDRSYVSLEGEGLPFWGRYAGAWNGTLIPNTAIGSNSTKIAASATGYNIIEIAYGGTTDNGEARHRAIRIKDLYLVGKDTGTTTYSGTGIKTTHASAQHDRCVFDSVMCHRLEKGIDLLLDSGIVFNCNVQDCSGDCVTYSGTLGQITNNLLYDCGGAGVKLSNAEGTVVTGNNIGNVSIGVWAYLGSNVNITGNSLRGTFHKLGANPGGYGIFLESTNNPLVNGNQIRFLDGSVTGQSASSGIYTSITTTANIVGNTIYTAFSTTGFAIHHTNGSSLISDNVISGSWNSGSDGKINFTPTSLGTEMGAGTTIGVNRGSPSNFRGPALSSSCTCIGWWRADTIAGLSNGNSVTTWQDASCGLYPLIPNTTSPTYQTNVINGLPVVRFDGVANALKSTSFPATSKCTVFAVVDKNTALGTQSIVHVGIGNNTALYTNGATINCYSPSGSLTSGPAITLTNWNIIELSINSGATSNIFVNGTAGTAGTTSTATATGIVLGANSAMSSEWFAGDIAEIIVFSGNNMSIADRAAVRGYLSSKYAIAAI